MSAREPGRRAEPGEGRERVAVSIAFAEPSAAQVVDAHPRDELADADPVDHLDRHAEPLVERERPPQLRHALLRLGDEQVAALGEIVARAGALFELAPEGGRELRETHVELVDELVTDAAEPAFRRARAETIALEEQDVRLPALAEEERRGDAHDPAPDDDRRRGPREVDQEASSSKR